MNNARPIVWYGSLAVPLRAQRDVDAAFAYLARDTRARALIERVEASPIPHQIAIDRSGDDSYHPESLTIRWDPHSAMRVDGNGRQSPALGLAHEMDHAVAPPGLYARLHDTGDPAFDDAEERRVILGLETHAAHTLHEGVRRDHRGTLYRVPSPVSR